MDTIIRVRRKREAEPVEALMLSLKRPRREDNEEGIAPQRVFFSLWKNAQPEDGTGTVEENHRLIDWDLNGHQAAPQLPAPIMAAGSSREVGEAVGGDELAFISDAAIGEVGGVDEKEGKNLDEDVIECNGTPMRPAAEQPECDDVFDFYRVAHPNAELVFEDQEEREIEIAIATRQEMLAYIGAMDGIEVESEADSEDSNDENNWRNDYPDESSEEDAEDYDGYRGAVETPPARRVRDFGVEEYGSSNEEYGGEDTEDDGEDELAEEWRNFRIG